MTRLRVLHIITHLAVGGATKNALAICHLSDPAQFDCALLCGATSHRETAMEGTAHSMDVPLHTLPSLRRPIQPFSDRKAYRKLVDWLRAHPWDVVHTHGSKAGILGRMAAAAAGVPVIVHTVHGWGHHERQRALVRRLYVEAERRAARVSDRLIVVADASREKGLADGIGVCEQYVTIRGGIDIARCRDISVDRAALRAELGIPIHAPVVGTVSRLASQKAPGDFVRMAALVRARQPDAHFVFVGGGPLDKKVRALADAASLSHQMHWLGYRHDVPELLRVFNVFVLNSLWEGLPAVFPQAMCAGLPSVATQVGGAAEAITDGENGFLVPPRQPQAAAERVLQLLTDAALCYAMGQNGLLRVDPQFNERHMVAQISDLYLSLAREKGLLEMNTPQEAALR